MEMNTWELKSSLPPKIVKSESLIVEKVLKRRTARNGDDEYLVQCKVGDP